MKEEKLAEITSRYILGNIYLSICKANRTPW